MSDGFVIRRGGGGAALNFNVVGGTSAPSSPKQNTIWVNTNTAIPSWSFGADEPNFYNLSTRTEGDAHTIMAPHKVSAGDILNFKIPKAVLVTREAICVRCPETGKYYYVRQGAGTAVSAWSVGTMVGVELSDASIPIGSYGSGAGTAYLRTWGKYYHKEGTVWFSTGASSPVAFNALKKNGVMVYPLSAKQYVSGAWVDKTAKICQNGAWVDWVTYLYNNGNEYADLTGGWAEKATDSDEMGITKGTSKITVSVNRTSGNHQGSIAGTAKMINLADVKTLRVTVADYSNSSGNANYCRIGVTNTGFNSTDTIAAYKNVSGNGIVELDVSSLSGSYYIFFGIQTRWASDYTTATYSVTSIYMN